MWSLPAALRALRASIVIPALFALTFKVVGNLQMASFAAFGSFATLVLVTFAGSRRDQLIAHLGLALVGSVLILVGTLVSSFTPAAALATVLVAFVVFFSAILGPNFASGVTGALLAYVLPAASSGGVSTVPDRLAGWWLASIAGTATVLIIRTPSTAGRLRDSTRALCRDLADTLEALLRGDQADDHVSRCAEGKSELLSAFNATPFRPTGLAARDRALAEAVELLEWIVSLVADTVAHRFDVREVPAADRTLLTRCAQTFRLAGAALAGAPGLPDTDELRAEQERATALTRSSPTSDPSEH